MNRQCITLAAVLVAAGTLAAPTAAQQRIRAFADGGDFSALGRLNALQTAQFRPGYDIGAGVGYDLRSGTAVRIDATWGRHDFRNGATRVPVNDLFLGADFLGRINQGPLALFGFVGGGAVAMRQEGISATSTEPYGDFGIGVSRAVAKTALRLFAQETSLVYRVKGFSASSALAGIDKGQMDVSFAGGVELRL